MKTTMLPEHPNAKSPAGADIRFLMDGETNLMAVLWALYLFWQFLLPGLSCNSCQIPNSPKTA